MQAQVVGLEGGGRWRCVGEPLPLQPAPLVARQRGAMTAPPLLHSLALGPLHLGGTDVTLACEDGSLACHAALLAATSPLLRRLLREDAGRHTLLLPGTSTSLLRHLLRLLYSGSAAPGGHQAAGLRQLVAVLLPHLHLAAAGGGATLQVVGAVAELEGYTAVRQTDTCTSWSREVREGGEEREEREVQEGIESWDVLENIDDCDDCGGGEVGEKNTEINEEERWMISENKDKERSGEVQKLEEALGKADDELGAGQVEVSDPALRNQNFILKVESKKKTDNKCCSVCQKTFLYPKDLKKHELIHQQSFPFHCKMCSKGIRTISNMYKHLRVKHSITEQLKSHILDDSGQPFAEPSKAPDTVPVELLQVEHVVAQGSAGLNKSGAQLYRCMVCEKMVTKYALKNHLSIHNGETKFKCDLCPKAYSTKSSLANHKVASHQDTKGASFKCSGCFRSFRTAKVRDHHATTCLQGSKSKKEAFECRLCHKMFGYKNNLVAHQRSVHGLEAKTIQEYSCKHCKQVIRGKLKLSKHIVSVHPDVAGELCDLCGKSFQTEVKLLRHISVHKSRERNLHCSFCPKKFFRKDILMVHEKVHTDPVICIKCGKSFPEQRYLNSHMVLHLDKTHDCLYCARSFLVRTCCLSTTTLSTARMKI